MKDEERVFRLTRRDGVIYWSGPYDHANQWEALVEAATNARNVDEEVRHLSIADAFDAADKKPEMDIVWRAWRKQYGRDTDMDSARCGKLHAMPVGVGGYGGEEGRTLCGVKTPHPNNVWTWEEGDSKYACSATNSGKCKRCVKRTADPTLDQDLARLGMA